MELFGFFIGALIAKIVSIAGFLGFAVGIALRKWYMAVFFGILVGLLDHFTLSAINPAIEASSATLLTSLTTAIIVGGTFSLLGWIVSERFFHAE
ncbi:MAG: hypothetical protein GYB49_16140 [Alphaproteobacteria bacterium]|nr:hypothetical protein [Alphaproteobacteria bacterium]